MEKEIKTFVNPDFGQVRTITGDDGEPRFCLKDVCEILGLMGKKVTQRLSKEVLSKYPLMTDGGLQQVTFVNEEGLYDVILDSRKPEAKAFRSWIVGEVLPQIRKTGGYVPAAPGDKEKDIMARALLIAQRTIELQQGEISTQRQQLNEQKPLVKFAKAVSSCPDSILIRDLAKLLTQNGIKIGQARLFYWLRLKGFLFKNETRPMQKWVEEGIFDTDVRLFNLGYGVRERCTTRVTGKGQRYFIEGFTSGRFCAENGRMK